jgi:catechol 2,3-dioxygenase-like lactoylglutathione lyase family enzyme
MNLERIDHIGINVHDLTQSFRFYQSVFGFEIVHKWVTTWMVGKGEIRLGLFQRPSAVPISHIDNAGAITHVAFRTDSAGFAAAQETFKKLGIAFDPPEDTGIAYSVFVLDPDGHQIEITTYDYP